MNRQELQTVENNCRKLLSKYDDLINQSNNKITWTYWREYNTHALETYPLNVDALTNVEIITRAIRKIKNPKQDGQNNIELQNEVKAYVRM